MNCPKANGSAVSWKNGKEKIELENGFLSSLCNFYTFLWENFAE
jgi:hypothetical protein